MLTRVALGTAIIALVATAPLVSADAHGTGTIYCYFGIPFYHTACDAELKGATRMHYITGEVALARLTVTWTTDSPGAVELGLTLESNAACAPIPECKHMYIEGESPLTATLPGNGASNAGLRGTIDVTPVCERSFLWPSIDADPYDCATPPFKLVMDQAFEYRWDFSR